MTLEQRLSRIERKLGLEDEDQMQAFAQEIGESIRRINRRLDRIDERLNGEQGDKNPNMGEAMPMTNAKPFRE